jgi:hypothetical protein
VQQVGDVRLGRHACLQSQFDGGEHGLLVTLEDESQNLDHLSVAARRLEHSLLQARKAGGSSANGAPLRSAPGLR